MAKPQDYADALRDLDAMRASGQIDQAAYDVHRARLLAESTKRGLPLWAWLLVGVVAVPALVWLLARVAMLLSGAM